VKAQKRILNRIQKMKNEGHLGDSKKVKPTSEGVYELRFDFGPGYRVYFTKKDGRLVILLAGGIKKTQNSDITKAIKLARQH